MPEPVRIALIDDDEEQLRVLSKFLLRHGHEVRAFSDPRKAVSAFPEGGFGVVITDVQMPGMSGLEVLEQVKSILPGAVVIMITGFGSVKAAVTAMKQGAFNYVSKPFDHDEFMVVLQKAVEQFRLRREVEEYRRNAGERYALGNIIGKSASMQAIFDVVRRVAPSRTNVLIEGESGTGKEVIARSIHRHSPRADAPFIAINCGAIPESLLESELFGHARGAYTGAVTREQGLLVSADTGTIFLDEIADMPFLMQSKLLRVLEDWEVRPVGGSETRKIDARVISATKSSLREAVDQGKFREDLFYRLNVVTVCIPPLRERAEDLPLLIERLFERIRLGHNRGTMQINRDALDALLAHTWPGNVRELENVLERAVILSRGKELTAQDLPASLRLSARPAAGGDELSSGGEETLEAMERRHIEAMLKKADWKRAAAAELLGINRRTLYRKIREYGIQEK
jgi:DNA-binding NtrC family response regulator